MVTWCSRSLVFRSAPATKKTGQKQREAVVIEPKVGCEGASETQTQREEERKQEATATEPKVGHEEPAGGPKATESMGGNGHRAQGVHFKVRRGRPGASFCGVMVRTSSISNVLQKKYEKLALRK